MWIANSAVISEGIEQIKISKNNNLISFRNWIDLIQNSESFIQFYIELLQSCSFDSFFWEVKPIQYETLEEPFEFVLVASNKLQKLTADSSSFEQYFEKEKQVISFPNLRGDAQLIVPTQISNKDHYTHLEKFIRNAPENQIVQF